MEKLEIEIGIPEQSSQEILRTTTTYDFLLSDKSTAYFLYITLLRTPKISGSVKSYIRYVLYYLMYFLTFLGLVEGYVVTQVAAEFLLKMPTHRAFFYTVGIVSFVCIWALIVAAAYSWRHTYRRLIQPMPSVDAAHVKRAVHAGTIFGGIFTVLGVIGEAISYPKSPAQIIGIWFFQYFFCCGIALSMFCIYIDARTSAAIVDDLISLASMESLTVHQLISARDQIDAIVSKSVTPNAVLGGAAFINGICFVLTMLMLRILAGTYLHEASLALYHEQLQQQSYLTGLVITYIASLLKEVLFLIYALYEISRVNDKADILYSKLSNSVWEDANKDHQRVKCYINYSGTPISFTLLTVRPTGLMVYSYVAGYIISLAIALVQEIISPVLKSGDVS